ncbi:MAG: metallophosphoesterase [Bacillaceae bacterium]|nr:metallophosphoesterase [Bacillaceae bacterium]
MYYLAGLIPIFIGFYKAYKNTHDVTINKVTLDQISLNREPFRVLHISDMHLENISVTPETLYHHLKNESIDLIALTGDFLDRVRSIPKLIPYLQVFNQFSPAYGIYAVYGNHDYVLRRKNFEQLNQTLKRYGVKTLQNEHDVIEVNGNKLNIIGIDDFSTNRSDFEKSYEGIEDGYNLVLTHDPNAVLQMEEYHFDYLLSGHFHGGQILYPKAYHLAKMGKLPKMNMIKGLHQFHGKPFYISEGLGQTGVNIRVGSRPEITIHEINVSPYAVRHSLGAIR